MDEDDRLEELGLDAVDNMADEEPSSPKPSSPKPSSGSGPASEPPKHSKTDDQSGKQKHKHSTPSTPKTTNGQNEEKRKKVTDGPPIKVDIDFGQPSKYEKDNPIPEIKKKKPYKRK